MMVDGNGKKLVAFGRASLHFSQVANQFNQDYPARSACDDHHHGFDDHNDFDDDHVNSFTIIQDHPGQVYDNDH